MTELKQVTVHLDDVAKALEVVGMYMQNLQIPAHRAPDWAATARVLTEVAQFVGLQKEQLKPKEEVKEEEKAA